MVSYRRIIIYSKNIIYWNILILVVDSNPSRYRRHGKKRPIEKIIHENDNYSVRYPHFYFHSWQRATILLDLRVKFYICIIWIPVSYTIFLVTKESPCHPPIFLVFLCNVKKQLILTWKLLLVIMFI